MRRPKNLPAHIHWPTAEEEAAINRGIAEEEAELEREFGPRRTRGPQKAPTMELISIRVDRDVAERLRASGKGWQAKARAALRKAVMG